MNTAFCVRWSILDVRYLIFDFRFSTITTEMRDEIGLLVKCSILTFALTKCTVALLIQ